MILWIGLCMALFESLLVLYIWPLRIDVDEEKPLPFYYFLTPDYWSKSKK
jgi:hypothetical protein